MRIDSVHVFFYTLVEKGKALVGRKTGVYARKGRRHV
jgi:hypothetical protein